MSGMDRLTDEALERVIGMAQRYLAYFPCYKSTQSTEDIAMARELLAHRRASQAATAHEDDLAVDRFAAVMKAKLAKKRDDGRGGWSGPECSEETLSHMLRDHVVKGDPVDVANFAMMLHQRGERIAQAAPAPHYGWIFLNPDTGIEWSEQHPVESGEAVDAENVRPATLAELKAQMVSAWSDLMDREASDDRAPDPSDGLREAWIAGAQAVHAEWLRANEAGESPPRGDPEFGEAADDYASSAAVTELATPAPPWDQCTCGMCLLHPIAPSDGLREAAATILAVLQDPDSLPIEKHPDWQAIYNAMTADHNESVEISGDSWHDWPSILIAGLEVMAQDSAALTPAPAQEGGE